MCGFSTQLKRRRDPLFGQTEYCTPYSGAQEKTKGVFSVKQQKGAVLVFRSLSSFNLILDTSMSYCAYMETWTIQL